ncbi:MAG: RNA methyltransferase [bacterium]|nr:RNA methyltransferase [bacterium]
MLKVKRPNLKLYLILENIRSLFNVGALFRTADGVGVEKILLVGYSGVDLDPQQETVKLHPHIHKTDMGTSQIVPWQHFPNIQEAVKYLRSNHKTITIAALEQTPKSQNILTYQPSTPAVGLILGNEIMGVSQAGLDLSDVVLEIPQWGKHNSLNVAVAGSIALYQLINRKANTS